MITFYPGPSKVHASVPKFVKEAYIEGVLSINHRSEQFIDLNKKTQALLREKLQVPEDYMIFYCSSATECWEIIAQSLIHTHSYHFYNGAFGEKWYNYTKKLCPKAIGYRFDVEQELKIKELDLSSEAGLICLTQNETSNGTQVCNERIKKIRKTYSNHLIAVDATSSMAGIAIDFSNADVWYASVQKCFGLPSGMSVMICSPRAIEKAKEIDENNHYNSLNFMIKNMESYQTPYTPNVLNIYLLMRTLNESKGIDIVQKRTVKNFQKYISVIHSLKHFSLVVKNDEVHSHTVLTVGADQQIISAIHRQALEKGIILGKGYGLLKESTFRIANFPAIKASEIKLLLQFLQEFDESI